MQRGNPYHDERGRFTTPYGACRIDKQAVGNIANHYAEYWGEERNRDDYEEWGSADWDDEYLTEAIEADIEEKKREYRNEVEYVLGEYQEGMCEKIRNADYETLLAISNGADDGVTNEIATSLKEESFWDDAIDDIGVEFWFNGGYEAVDYRYRRIVSKCNGNLKLFAMAADEKDGYGLGGCTRDYATQKIKVKGLMGRFESWKMTRGIGKSYNEVGKNTKKLSSNEYPDGTYDAITLQPLEYEKGYQVTYCQIGDSYTEEEHNKLMAEFLKHTDDGNVSLGKFEGSPEHSFHFTSKEQAVKFAEKYNQISIFDWETKDAIETGGTGRR